MNKKIIIMVIILFLATGIFSNQWNVVDAQGTIPPVVPTAVIVTPVIPVTGGVTKTISCSDPSLLIIDVAKVEFTPCPNPSIQASMIVLTETDLKILPPLNYFTEVFQVTYDPSYKGKILVGVYLDDTEKLELKKDSDLGLYWYNASTSKWDRIIAFLEDDYFTAETDRPGIYTVGKIK